MGLDLTNAPNVADVEDAGTVITLVDLNGDPYKDPETGAEIKATIAGTYSKRFTKAQQKQQDALSRKPGKRSAEQKQQDSRDLFAHCVITWDLTSEGKMTPPSKIFAALPHIYDQVVNAATDHAGFFATSSDS